MNLFSIISNLRPQDILDVLFLSVVTYHLYCWFRGTKAFKALVGLLVLGTVYTMASFWGLFLTTWVFQILWQVLILLIIILFQSEIRQVLERVNPLQNIVLRKASRLEEWIPGFVRAVFKLAKHKTGALIVIERLDSVNELVLEGQGLEATPSPEILMSIFQKNSPLHDGAVLIRGSQIAHVACFLPLSSAEELPKKWGTRHRAALGLSERCDAWVVVVSEESGDISLARGSEIVPIESEPMLSKLVMDGVRRAVPKKKSPKEGLRFILSHRWQAKAGSMVLVSILWFLFAGQQNFEVTFPVPLKTKNLPPHMIIIDPVNPKVKITVEGLRKDASTLNERNVIAELDLSQAGSGKKIFAMHRDRVTLPSDRVKVVLISPTEFEFQFEEKTGKIDPVTNPQR